MVGSIVASEDRNTVNKFKNWYKEKLIDTGKSQDFEKKVDDQIAREKKVIKVVGTVATIVLLFCPADGPVGEICTALATPLLVKLVDIKGKLIKQGLAGKRKFESQYIGADGSNKEVHIPDFSLADIATEAKDFRNVISSMEGLGKSK